MIMSFVMVIIGLTGLRTGAFKITYNRQVKGSVAHLLGVALLLGAVGSFVPDFGGTIQLVTVVGVIIAGLVTAEKIQPSPKAPRN
ncbi:MAG TPA: hypothetical protein VMT24_09950 [Aggregatilineaceae bacterium]|nr:hypothetical protein [Aggregatilineaceae bacterium]